MAERGRGRGRGAYYKAKYGNKRGRSDSQSSVNNNDRDDISAEHNNYDHSADHDMPLPYLKSHDLHTMLTQMEGQSYGNYKRIKGSYLFQNSQITLIIDQVQRDAYASPSRLRARIPMTAAGFPADVYSNRVRAIALADILTREFYDGLHSRKLDFKPSHDSWKAAKGGHITIDKPSQNVLHRSTVVINPQYVEVRFTFGLPAQGRSIMGFYCAELLVEQLPEVLEKSFYYNSLDKDKLQKWVDCVEDQEYLRGQVNSQGFIAFIPNGAILPRQSGASDIPLPDTSAIKWQSPQSLERSFNLIHAGTITGTVIPKGVTLIVGGGFHGKSTLLKAIEMGIHPKIPGDGREYLVADDSIVKVRAEDGRNVSAVDITPFITNLPYGKDTTSFSTPDASGSTSMAADIQEALEIGATGLLFDEDTSATNFLIRDTRMQALIHKNNEPITPLIYKARQLFEEKSVSSILVIGGCGDYLDIADTVICIEHYVPKDYTFRVKEIIKMYPSTKKFEGGLSYGRISSRTPTLPSPTHYKDRVRIASLHSLTIYNCELDLSHIDQLAELSQTRYIGESIAYLAKFIEEKFKANKEVVSLKECVDYLERETDEKGCHIVNSGWIVGWHSKARKFEVAAAINRLRNAKFVQI